jgi:hypothetical protein
MNLPFVTDGEEHRVLTAIIVSHGMSIEELTEFCDDVENVTEVVDRLREDGYLLPDIEGMPVAIALKGVTMLADLDMTEAEALGAQDLAA